MFKGFGNAQSKAIGVFDAYLTIGGKIYRNEVYVVPVEAMDSRMLLGKDVQEEMNINIQGGRIIVRKITGANDDALEAKSKAAATYR